MVDPIGLKALKETRKKVDKESELGVEHTIRELPNGVKDEVNFTDNKVVKRISNEEVTNKGNSLYSREPYDMYDYLVDVSNAQASILLLDGVAYNFNVSDNTANSYTFRFGDLTNTTLKDRVQLRFPKGKIPPDTGRIIYQLAEPMEISLPEPMSPNTREIARLSEQVDKLTNAIVALGGTII